MLEVHFEGANQLDDRDALAVNRCTPGIAQEVQGQNLGYGQFYYGLVRMIRPRNVLVIGSGYGFTPGMIALALKHDGGRGRVMFVDPGYDGRIQGPERAHGGTGVWRNPNRAQARWDCLGVQGLIRHFPERNDEFFPRFRSRKLSAPDLAVIDGAHDLDNAAYDTEETLKILKIPGYMLHHDSTSWFSGLGMGVNQVVEALELEHQVMTFPGRAGLTLTRVVKRGKRLPLTEIPPPKVLGLGALALGASFALGWMFRGVR